MLFAAALVASVPCDGSPALACEVNMLAPANSSSVWALMGGHDIKLYQPVSDVLTVTPPPGVAPKALELVFVHGVYHGGFTGTASRRSSPSSATPRTRSPSRPT